MLLVANIVPLYGLSQTEFPAVCAMRHSAGGDFMAITETSNGLILSRISAANFILDMFV